MDLPRQPRMCLTLVPLNGPNPDPHLQAGALMWPQTISTLTEMPDAWGCLWLPSCLPCSLARGSGVGPGCEAPCATSPQQETPWPPRSPQPLLHLDIFLPLKHKSSLHGKYKHAHNGSVPSRSHGLISHCYEALFHPKNRDAADAKLTNLGWIVFSHKRKWKNTEKSQKLLSTFWNEMF